MLQGYIRRTGWLLGGLLVSAVGITMMLQANVGLEPWSTLQGSSRASPRPAASPTASPPS